MSKGSNEIRPNLEGRVAQILNARELVINIGAKDGVEYGMKFAVLAASPLEIKDPETGEVLDILDREKVRVEAGEVRNKVTVCRTYKTSIRGGMLGLGIPNLFSEPRQVVETLKAEDFSFPEPLSEAESYVKIGDRVRLIED